MRMGLCLALLLCAALVSDSDAARGSSKKTTSFFSKVKKSAKKSVTWVAKNCGISLGVSGIGVNCAQGQRKGRRKGRALGEALLAHQQRALDNVCADLEDIEGITNGGVPFDLVKDIFEEVDGGTGGDDVLDETEYAQFMAALDAFKSCVSNKSSSS